MPALTLLLLAAPLSQTQDPKPVQTELHFRVVTENRRVGSATFTRQSKNDEVVKSLTLNLKVNEQVVSVIIETTAKKDGTPLKKKFIQNGSGGGTTNAIFSPTGVDVIKPTPDNAGAKTNYPAPAGAVLADPTEAWFSSTKPAIGAKVTYANFNVQSLAWEENTAVYIEDVEAKADGKSYPSHHIRVSSASGSIDEFVDDHGDPIVIDQGPIRIERSEK
jgi:hypothetical protein